MAVSQAQSSEAASPEHQRLAEADQGQKPWRTWGPYLSERQWGTVREDDSPDGNAWESFSHDQARSRAYQWGEDGLAGISDDHQHLCFALALWNGKDPIIKERLFGLTNSEGNLIIALPDTYKKKFSLRVFKEDGTPMFHMRNIKEPQLLIDRSNFLHSGWFKYDLYEDEKLREQNKFFIPPEVR